MTYLKPAIAVISLLAGTAAYAQDDFSAQLKARQGQMRVIAINLGILGGMARGKIEYNAEAAQKAADSLVGVAMIDQGPLWPEGSDEGAIEGTIAKATIWTNADDFNKIWDNYKAGAMAMQAVAANGQEAIGPAMGGIGGTCKACHDNHRVPTN